MLNLRKRVVTSLLLIPAMNLIYLTGVMQILSWTSTSKKQQITPVMRQRMQWQL